MSEISKFLGFDQQTPTPLPPAQIGQGTQDIMNAQATSAMRPSSAFAGDITKGISQRVGQIGQSGNSDPAQTGMSPAAFEAMRNVYAGQTGDALNRINMQSSFEGEQRKAQALKLAAQNAMQQQQTKTNYFQTLTDSYNQMEAQRAQFVSQISGLASYGMGSYAGARNKTVAPKTSPDMSMSENMFNGPGNSVAQPIQMQDQDLNIYNSRGNF
jgi:hypothetical protein